MSKQPLDLARLLSPMGQQNFFEQHWEQKPLHLRRGRSSFYDDVLTLPALEHLIASPDLRYPAIQLSKGGAYFPPEVYCDDIRFGSDNFTGVPNVQKIAAEYRAGATVVLPALQRTWLLLGELCSNIESELNHVVHGNAYLTPGATSGFTPHYDTHEVMVLQIAGNKHWRIYPPPVELPHRRQPFSPLGYTLPSRPLLEVDLAPGDLLYLPRGYIHTTATSNGPSAHITIGIAVYTWLDLAGELLQSAMTTPKFRRALPPGFANRPELRPLLNKEFSAVLDDLRAAADPASLVDVFVRRVAATPASKAVFQSAVTVIGAATQLMAPAPDQYRITQPKNLVGKFAVEFKQRRFVLPDEAKTAVESMRTLRTFTTPALSSSMDLEAKLALVRLLVEKGFLTTLAAVAPSVPEVPS